MDEKLKKSAIRLSNKIKVDELTPKQTYFALRNKVIDLKEYFSKFTPEEMVKLPFYIYSYKKTGNFDLAEKIIYNIHFIGLVQDYGDDVSRECPSCEGTGEMGCPKCDSDLRVDCPQCEREAEVCADCGEREDNCDCYEFEPFECPTCNGEGEVLCDMCEGRGEVKCTECEGRGEIEMPGVNEVRIIKIMTWDPKIISKCEISYYDPINPAFKSEDQLQKLDNYIFLQENFATMELYNDMDPDSLYCFFFSSNAQLKFVNNKLSFNTESLLLSVGQIK